MQKMNCMSKTYLQKMILYMPNKITISSLIATTIFLQSFSFLGIKYATMTQGVNTWIYLGVAFFFILARALVWQIVLKFVSLSKAYPFSSLVQVLILVYATILFHEEIMIHHIIGLACMLAGLFLITKSQ